MIIDTHIHADARTSDDFEKMFINGIDTAISCGYYPYKVSNETVLLNHLERILYYDTERARKCGLKLKVALGIHPTNTIKSSNVIFDKLYEYIYNKEIIAIGEIGLENLTQEEKDIFKRQLEIADETKTKVIIHTPRKNKQKVAKEIRSIVLEKINPNLVVIDHINSAIIEDFIDENFKLGLTVQPQKMEAEEAITILKEYDFDKFLLNSDISNKASDPLSVPKTVQRLKKLEFNSKKIDKVAFKNAKSFFNI